MNSQDMISRLESKGIRPTANRILVMKTLMGEQNPQSLSNRGTKDGFDGQVEHLPYPYPLFGT